MAVGSTPDAGAWSPFAALHLVVTLLGEVESVTPTSSFYDRLAEATCRLGTMERAVVFLYDDALRRVRAVGSHGVDLALFAGDEQRAEHAPLAGRALELDRVLEASGDLESQLPAAHIERLGISSVACIPMSAGGKGYGVVLADMGGRTALSDPEREFLWTVGKVCALAQSARIATRGQERARQLADRLDLARDLHERVVQRLFGVSLALDADDDFTTAQRARCAAELRAAAQDLREAMQRPLAPSPSTASSATLREELERLDREHPDLGLCVTWDDDAAIPADLEPLAHTVLAEALRNARKHATPETIDVHVRRDGDAVTFEVINDGVDRAGRSEPARPAGGAGMGLRLAAFEALNAGAAVDFGPTPPDRWHVRLVLPVAA